jgi:predicted LPLAT superfamily acyltransferase
LFPITAYFMAFSNRTSAASRSYLRRALGREPALSDRFRHYHTFACTLLDRIYALAGRDRQFDISVHHFEILQELVSQGRSCLLVGSHLGSFEMIRAVGRTRGGLRIKALMYRESTPLIASLYQSLNPDLHDDVIYVGTAASLVGLDRHAAEGTLLAVLGDRSVDGEKRVRCQFFGEPAYFPQAPVLLGQILGLPLILFVCLHRGWGRYEVYFEELSGPPPTARNRREEAANAVMQRYAERLEHYCRTAPYNWFNFYDFWRTDS